MEEEIFEPQYPAELYTSRPNPTALLSPIYDWTFKAMFTQEYDYGERAEIMAAGNIVKNISKSNDNWEWQNSLYKAECDYNSNMGAGPAARFTTGFTARSSTRFRKAGACRCCSYA